MTHIKRRVNGPRRAHTEQGVECVGENPKHMWVLSKKWKGFSLVYGKDSFLSSYSSRPVDPRMSSAGSLSIPWELDRHANFWAPTQTY